MDFAKKYMYFFGRKSTRTKKSTCTFLKKYTYFLKLHELFSQCQIKIFFLKKVIFLKNLSARISDHPSKSTCTFFKKLQKQKSTCTFFLYVYFFCQKSTCTFLKSTCTFLQSPLFAGKNSNFFSFFKLAKN